MGKKLSWAILSSRFLDDGTACLLGSNGANIPDTQSAAESASHLVPNLLESGIEALREMLVRLDGSLVIEDDTRDRGDPAVAQFLHKEIAINGHDVYHLRGLADRVGTSIELEQFVAESSFGYPLNGFVVRGMNAKGIQTLVGEGEFDQIARRCEFTLHSIYDGDAMAVWLPSPR